MGQQLAGDLGRGETVDRVVRQLGAVLVGQVDPHRKAD
jgi:hypothetical protein